MRHAALFNGIGGFQLAASWIGWENVWHCEIDKFCNKVVKQHFPNSICYEDIKQLDAREWRGRIDIISGGFPCQPFSVAGQRKGTEDDRYLWPEMLRIIGEVQPRFIVGENVGGLVNWSNGMVFDQVQTDLENEGYEVAPFILPACAVNAPHRRDRIWFVANASGNVRDFRPEFQSNGWQNKTEQIGLGSFATAANPDGNVHAGGLDGGRNKRTSERSEGENEQQEGRSENWQRVRVELGAGSEDVADTYIQGLPQRVQSRERENRRTFDASQGSEFTRTYSTPGWSQFPTQPPVCGGNDGISFELHIIKRIENEYKMGGSESKPTISFITWQVLRVMWENRNVAKASPELYISRVYDSLPGLPRENGQRTWLAEIEEREELCGLWEKFYAMPYQEAQQLQQRVLECFGEIERRKKMEQSQRTDRIKALGNAIVPQVAYQIFKAIQNTTHTTTHQI